MLAQMHFGKINSRERNDAMFCRLAEGPSEEGAHLLCRLQRRLGELQEWLPVLGIQWGFLGVSSFGRGCAERVSVRLNKPLNLSNVFLVLHDDP